MKCLTLAACFLFAGCAVDTNVYYVDGCRIDRIDGGQVVTCGMDQVHIPDQMDIIAIHDPCGDGEGPDSVVIELDGRLYVLWRRGVGITLLEPYRHYQTKDRQKCKFMIGLTGMVVLD